MLVGIINIVKPALLLIKTDILSRAITLLDYSLHRDLMTEFRSHYYWLTRARALFLRLLLEADYTCLL
jgi:hypothetical protein